MSGDLLPAIMRELARELEEALAREAALNEYLWEIWSKPHRASEVTQRWREAALAERDAQEKPK